MPYKRLFILVEGDDDERFFNTIIKPKYEEIYDSVMLWQYAQEKKKRVKGFLKSVKAMHADYIYVADINFAPCVTRRKQTIRKTIRDIDNDKIAVIIREIEGWYLAGLGDVNLKKLRIRRFYTTDEVTKGDFDNLIPRRFSSRIDFMIEILKHFSTQTAKRKNTSFRYFHKKHISAMQAGK